MKIKLKEITDLHTGFYTKPHRTGEIVYLQAKNFSERGKLIEIPVKSLPLNSKTKKHILKDGDILFSAKGPKNFAYLFNHTYSNAVASSTFLILRLKGSFLNTISRDYLVWFLNHSDTMEKLKNRAKGTSIPSISISSIENLEISIPDIDIQKSILQINDLKQQETDLREKIQILRENLIQQQILNLLK